MKKRSFDIFRAGVALVMIANMSSSSVQRVNALDTMEGVPGSLCEMKYSSDGYQSGPEMGNFTPGLFASDDCNEGLACSVTVPAVGVCTPELPAPRGSSR